MGPWDIEIVQKRLFTSIFVIKIQQSKKHIKYTSTPTNII
jgi:hypothetical protein